MLFLRHDFRFNHLYRIATANSEFRQKILLSIILETSIGNGDHIASCTVSVQLFYGNQQLTVYLLTHYISFKLNTRCSVKSYKMLRRTNIFEQVMLSSIFINI